MTAQFENLFTPIKIGAKTVRNRIMFPAHGTSFQFFADNTDPNMYVEYMRARARGGCGLAVISTLMPHWSSHHIGGPTPPTPAILIPKLRKMADAIHENGALVVVQILHKGSSGDSVENIHPLWGFTARSSPDSRAEVCHEMDNDEVEEVLDSFAIYARCAKEGGLDGVELHGTHGYLLQQSWSNWTNQRTDKWGKQMAFANELSARVRAAVGSDLIVGVRIASDDFHPGGMDNEAMKKVAQALESTGKIDYLSISEGSQYSHYSLSAGPMYIPPAAWVPLASGIKQAVKSTPVVATCRINEPALAESILADGHADMVNMCRALIADPEFANKAREGRVDDIRLCIACNQGCLDRSWARMFITCLQNAVVGKEKEIGTIERAPKKKSVMVIGGGPGGMEAARVAALRGHDVTLYEKEEQLGGQINTLAKAPGREEFGQVVRYLSTQLNKLGVKVKLGVEATEETVKREKPDVVIVATGAKPYINPVPGSEQDNVFTSSQVLDGKATIGERVVVFDTTGLQEGCTVADFLVEQSKKVEIITPFAAAGANMGYSHLPLIWPRLLNKGIVFSGFTSLKKISGHTVTVFNVYTQQERTIEDVDTVVMSTGYRANDSLYRTLKGKVKELHGVGDCLSPRRALDAIHEGYNTAFKI